MSIFPSQAESKRDPCNFSSDPGMIAFYVDGEQFFDPNEIIVADKQEIRVVFE